MADYFTQCSFCVYPESQEQLDELVRLIEDEEKRDPYESAGFDWHIQGTDSQRHLWIRDNAGELNIDQLIRILRTYLTKFDLDKPIGFEWAHTCSKPRTDGFGGGALVVWADHHEVMSTIGWIRERMGI